MSKVIPNYALYGDEEGPGWQNSLFLEMIPQRARPYQFGIRPHTHGSLIQILLLTRGSVEAVVDQAKVKVDAPCLLVVPARTVHGWKFTDDVDGPIVTAAQRPLESLADLLMPALLQTLQTPSILRLSSLQVIHSRLANEAQRDLVYTANSIRQLADRLGFEDEAYFSRFFRKQTGLTPRQFRALAMTDVTAVE
ncbi:MAG: transcriptional regulator, AraC family [Rhodoferax sp.]|nr:transcriptional regulator, AraC family [Rhodoferax sp.]